MEPAAFSVVDNDEQILVVAVVDELFDRLPALFGDGGMASCGRSRKPAIYP